MGHENALSGPIGVLRGAVRRELRGLAGVVSCVMGIPSASPAQKGRQEQQSGGNFGLNHNGGLVVSWIFTPAPPSVNSAPKPAPKSVPLIGWPLTTDHAQSARYNTTAAAHNVRSP